MTPMKPRISTVSKVIGILLIWILAVAITLPYAMSQELIPGKYCINAGLLLNAKEENIYVVKAISSFDHLTPSNKIYRVSQKLLLFETLPEF